MGISKAQQKLVRSLEQKKYRQREGLFVAEGPKVVGDLLRAGFRAEQLFATVQCLADGMLPCSTGVNTVEVSDDELRRVSFLQHPQGVLAVFHMPAMQYVPDVSALRSSLVLALDGVQDPGNLGTIIRIADWFGIDTVCCSTDTADAWNPKVVQATMGSIARVHIIYTDLVALADRAAGAAVPVYGTLLDGADIYRQTLTTNGIIVMGNEGNGISPDMRCRVTHRLLIPDFHNGQTADSLNVAIATAITCSEFRRRQ